MGDLSSSFPNVKSVWWNMHMCRLGNEDIGWDVNTMVFEENCLDLENHRGLYKNTLSSSHWLASATVWLYLCEPHVFIIFFFFPSKCNPSFCIPCTGQWYRPFCNWRFLVFICFMGILKIRLKYRIYVKKWQ